MNKIRNILVFLLVISSPYGWTEENATDKSQQSSPFNAYLAVENIDETGLVLTLNDGSEWDIKYFGGGWRLLGWGWTEQWEVSHWDIGDTIEIQYPGSGNLIDFILIIQNLSKKQETCATLRQAPSASYSTCLWVANFDEETSHVTLSDGTAWRRLPGDMYGALTQFKPHDLSKWEPGDPVTLIHGRWLHKNTILLWNHTTNEMPIVKRLAWP